MTKKTKPGTTTPATRFCQDCTVIPAVVIIRDGDKTGHLCKFCAREMIYNLVTSHYSIAFTSTDNPLTITVEE